MDMYICIQIYMFIYIHKYIYIYLCIYIYVYTSVVYIDTYIHQWTRNISVVASPIDNT